MIKRHIKIVGGHKKIVKLDAGINLRHITKVKRQEEIIPPLVKKIETLHEIIPRHIKKIKTLFGFPRTWIGLV